MRRKLPLVLVSLFVLLGLNRLYAAPKEVAYNRDIKPILSAHCYACHGPDENKRKAHLRLDLRAEALHKVIKPGQAANSILVERVSSKDPDDLMPPPRSKMNPLTAEQIDLLRRWIDQGAAFDIHWAYVKPVRPPLPPVKNQAWVNNPIDAFIAAGHEAHGFMPAPEADRVTLLRRLSFDLTGLPPTPAEVETFLADTSAQAWTKQVQRLLASRHFGERLAMVWLDLVRYADTCGYHSDNHRDVALFRDYVIDGFNTNKPFDQFTIEQLAGDLLPHPTTAQKIGSGYNRLLETTEEGGAQPKEYMAKYAADRVRNASTVWLAATMGCAQCHNHKFDPYTTKDFYSFAAFFADIQEKAVGRQDQTPLPTPAQQAQLKQLDQQIGRLQAELKKAPAESLRKTLAQTQAQREAIVKSAPTTLITMAGPAHVVRILPRGNWLDDSGEVVQPAVPPFLSALHVTGRRANRLDLARWLVAPDHPLTARVMVNRLWKLMFGQGIVKSLDDFGSQGSLPSHPQLLDWLAVEFVESGWNIKHILELMVLSNSYRQSSVASHEMRERDPANVWLARQGRFRLDAEMVRDNALAVSGLLSDKIGGPSVKPYQPAGYWSFLNFPVRDWQPSQGEDQHRRGLYTYWCRTFLHPSLLAFDAPTREECTVERARSCTPLQALVLLNDPIYVEAARSFAARILEKGGKDVPARLDWAFHQAVSRPVRPEEVKLLTGLYQKHLAQFRNDRPGVDKLLAIGQLPLPKGVDHAELAAWTSLTRVILNLHETITRN